MNEIMFQLKSFLTKNSTQIKNIQIKNSLFEAWKARDASVEIQILNVFVNKQHALNSW